MSIWLPGAAVLMAAAVRRLAREDLWLDEAYSLAATQDLVASLAGDRGAMAVYYTLLTPWTWVSNDPAWIRSLSLLAAVGGVVVFALTVARMAGPTAGRVSGLLAGASPLVVRYAVEARAYGVVLLLTAIAWYALDRTLEKPDRARYAVAFAGAAVLLPLTHGLAMVQIGAMGAAVVWSRPDRDVVRRVLPGFVAAVVTTAALLAVGANDIGSWVPSLTASWVRRSLLELLHPFAPIALVLVATAAVATWRLVRGGPAADPLGRFRQVAFLLWGPGAVVGLLILSLVRPSFLSRYALASVLGLMALVALVIASSRLVAAVTITLTALLLVPQMVLDPRRPTWTEGVEAVAAAHHPGDAVVFASPDARIPFEAAWMAMEEPLDLTVVGPGDPLGTYDRFARVADADELAAQVVAFDRVWVIDQRYDHQPSRLHDLMGDPRVVERFTERGSWSVPAPVAPIEILLLTA